MEAVALQGLGAGLEGRVLGGAAGCGAPGQSRPRGLERGWIRGLRSCLDIQQGHPLVLVATLPAVDHLCRRAGHSTACRRYPDWPPAQMVKAEGRSRLWLQGYEESRPTPAGSPSPRVFTLGSPTLTAAPARASCSSPRQGRSCTWGEQVMAAVHPGALGCSAT